MDYPYELHRVPGSQALEKLHELRKRQNGIAVILGNQEAFEMSFYTMENYEGPDLEELLEMAKDINAKSWLEARKNDDPEYYEIAPEPWNEENEKPNSNLIAHIDYTTRYPYTEIKITVIPALESWHVPCYLRIGNWNSVPKAEEHSAIFKYWLEKHGATVACIAHDIIEFTVERPPSTREAALELAREQYIYCPDIVHQNLGSVEALAATLLHASVWFFWWD
jgi:Domain of unknown function (DUF4253)